jgi:hypothetical protein
LTGESSEEFGGVTPVFLTSGKEEACPKTFIFAEAAGNCTSDGRLARACRAAEPKNALITMPFAPLLDFVKNTNSSSFEAFRRRAVLLERIKGCIFRKRETVQLLNLSGGLEGTISIGGYPLKGGLASTSARSPLMEDCSISKYSLFVDNTWSNLEVCSLKPASNRA